MVPHAGHYPGCCLHSSLAQSFPEKQCQSNCPYPGEKKDRGELIALDLKGAGSQVGVGFFSYGMNDNTRRNGLKLQQ